MVEVVASEIPIVIGWREFGVHVNFDTDLSDLDVVDALLCVRQILAMVGQSAVVLILDLILPHLNYRHVHKLVHYCFWVLLLHDLVCKIDGDVPFSLIVKLFGHICHFD